MFTMPKTITVYIIGDKEVGKTQLLLNFNQYHFNSLNTADHYDREISVYDQNINVRTFDYPGSKQQEKLRSTNYKITDTLILCASVNNTESLANLTTRWTNEIKKYKCQKLPKLLAITKSDLDDHEETYDNHIQQADITHVAHQLHVDDVFKCSAKTGDNVELLFKRAAELAIRKNQTNRKTCLFC